MPLNASDRISGLSRQQREAVVDGLIKAELGRRPNNAASQVGFTKQSNVKESNIGALDMLADPADPLFEGASFTYLSNKDNANAISGHADRSADAQTAYTLRRLALRGDVDALMEYLKAECPDTAHFHHLCNHTDEHSDLTALDVAILTNKPQITMVLRSLGGRTNIEHSAEHYRARCSELSMSLASLCGGSLANLAATEDNETDIKTEHQESPDSKTEEDYNLTNGVEEILPSRSRSGSNNKVAPAADEAPVTDEEDTKVDELRTQMHELAREHASEEELSEVSSIPTGMLGRFQSLFMFAYRLWQRYLMNTAGSMQMSLMVYGETSLAIDSTGMQSRFDTVVTCIHVQFCQSGDFDADDDVQDVTISDFRTNLHSLSNLETGKAYYVRCRLRNPAGCGEWVETNPPKAIPSKFARKPETLDHVLDAEHVQNAWTQVRDLQIYYAQRQLPSALQVSLMDSSRKNMMRRTSMSSLMGAMQRGSSANLNTNTGRAYGHTVVNSPRVAERTYKKDNTPSGWSRISGVVKDGLLGRVGSGVLPAGCVSSRKMKGALLLTCVWYNDDGSILMMPHKGFKLANGSGAVDDEDDDSGAAHSMIRGDLPSALIAPDWPTGTTVQNCFQEDWLWMNQIALSNWSALVLLENSAFWKYPIEWDDLPTSLKAEFGDVGRETEQSFTIRTENAHTVHPGVRAADSLRLRRYFIRAASKLLAGLKCADLGNLHYDTLVDGNGNTHIVCLNKTTRSTIEYWRWVSRGTASSMPARRRSSFNSKISATLDDFANDVVLPFDDVPSQIGLWRYRAGKKKGEKQSQGSSNSGGSSPPPPRLQAASSTDLPKKEKKLSFLRRRTKTPDELGADSMKAISEIDNQCPDSTPTATSLLLESSEALKSPMRQGLYVSLLDSFTEPTCAYVVTLQSNLRQLPSVWVRQNHHVSREEWKSCREYFTDTKKQERTNSAADSDPFVKLINQKIDVLLDSFGTHGERQKYRIFLDDMLQIKDMRVTAIFVVPEPDMVMNLMMIQDKTIPPGAVAISSRLKELCHFGLHNTFKLWAKLNATVNMDRVLLRRIADEMTSGGLDGLDDFEGHFDIVNNMVTYCDAIATQLQDIWSSLRWLPKLTMAGRKGGFINTGTNLNPSEDTGLNDSGEASFAFLDPCPGAVEGQPLLRSISMQSTEPLQEVNKSLSPSPWWWEQERDQTYIASLTVCGPKASAGGSPVWEQRLTLKMTPYLTGKYMKLQGLKKAGIVKDANERNSHTVNVMNRLELWCQYCCGLERRVDDTDFPLQVGLIEFGESGHRLPANHRFRFVMRRKPLVRPSKELSGVDMF
eukprot:Clim_evm16s243 gene=Clim_evmTU16s243